VCWKVNGVCSILCQIAGVGTVGIDPSFVLPHLHGTFVRFWPVKFSSGRLGASLLYSDSDSGLADEAKLIYSHCHLT
jgi:hypothetical protein